MQDGRPKARIEALHLKMPGRDPQSAARMARGVADHLATLLPARGPVRIDALNVRAAAGASDEQIARNVAAAIRKATR